MNLLETKAYTRSKRVQLATQSCVQKSSAAYMFIVPLACQHTLVQMAIIWVKHAGVGLSVRQGSDTSLPE